MTFENEVAQVYALGQINNKLDVIGEILNNNNNLVIDTHEFMSSDEMIDMIETLESTNTKFILVVME